MKRFFIILLLGLYFGACTSPVSPPPPDVIPESQMTSMLVDLHIAEARVDRMGVVTDSAAIYYKKAQQEIFKKNKVTEKRYYKSYDYYLHNVSELDKIYARVVDSLSLKEVESTKAANTPESKKMNIPERKLISK